MSGPQGSDPNQSWQPPGHECRSAVRGPADPGGTDGISPGNSSSRRPGSDVASPRVHAARRYPQYQQPAEQAVPTAIPANSSPATGSPEQFGSPARPVRHARSIRSAGPVRSARSVRPVRPARPVRSARSVRSARPVPAAVPSPTNNRGRSVRVALIGGIAAAIGCGRDRAPFWCSVSGSPDSSSPPSWTSTRRRPVCSRSSPTRPTATARRTSKTSSATAAQTPTVKKGGTFDCNVSIDGAQKHVTVTFQDNKGTYEVGRPQ